MSASAKSPTAHMRKSTTNGMLFELDKHERMRFAEKANAADLKRSNEYEQRAREEHGHRRRPPPRWLFLLQRFFNDLTR